MKRNKILTPVVTFVGRQIKIDTFSDKPPKLRFKPGQFVEYQKSIWEIVYCYRTKDTPNIWKFCLEESKAKDKIGLFLAENCGNLTPKIMYDCFRDSMDAMTYFADIPAHGDRVHVTTQNLLRARLLTSGEILAKGERVREL